MWFEKDFDSPGWGLRWRLVMGLKRATRDRWISCVCGGLAYRFGWSSNVVRLVTVVLSVAIPGFSLIPVILIYAALAYFLPESEAY